MKRFFNVLVGVLVAFQAITSIRTANAYRLFGPYPWGETDTYYLKWGDIFHPGTPGGTITWSLMPDGTTIDPSFTDVNISGVSSLGAIMNGLGYDNALAAIERALDRWSAAANIYFVRVADSGAPFNAIAAMPPDTGQIRLGAFAITGGGGAVGYAPPPNGGTLEGDVLLNSNSSFYFDDGGEGELIDVFNDFEGLITHELGHAMGLDHSDVCSVMSVDFECYKYVNRELDQDDLAAVRFLYGPALTADFDRNNMVDGDDLLTWFSGFGVEGAATPTNGDATRDATVDGADFMDWQQELGGGAPVVSGSSAPEPRGIALAAISATVWRLFRRRQKCSRNTPHFGHLANHIGTSSPQRQRMLWRTTDEPSKLLPLEPAEFSSGTLSSTDESDVLGMRTWRSSR